MDYSEMYIEVDQSPINSIEEPLPQPATSTGEIPFQNELIIETILKYLTFHQLKACRRVNKSWQRLCTKFVRQKDLSIVNLIYDSRQKTFCHHSSNCLTDLIEIIQGSLNQKTEFPCTSFSFVGGALKDKEVESFFQLYGPQIKYLSLSSALHENTCKKAFKNILQLWTPSLEKLQVCGFYSIPWETNEKLSLLSLRKFAWTYDENFKHYGTISKILSGAPYLEIIENVDPEYDLGVITQCGKASVVKELICRAPPNNFMEYVHANGGEHKLIKLIVFEHSPLDGLNELLKSSRFTLQVLHLPNKPGDQSLTFPVLTKLRELKVRQNLSILGGVDVNRHFPNLVTFDVSNVVCDKKKVPKFDFSSSPLNQFTKCQTLIVRDNCSQVWMKKLYGLCPNFKKCVVIGHAHLDLILPLIFKIWTHLGELEIEIYAIRLPPVNFDSVFTGLDPITCQNGNNGVIKGQGQGINKLKDLKILRLIFKLPKLDNFFDPLPGMTPFQFSEVSVLYGFKLMENLRVSVMADHSLDIWFRLRRRLLPLTPHVIFERLPTGRELRE